MSGRYRATVEERRGGGGGIRKSHPGKSAKNNLNIALKNINWSSI